MLARISLCNERTQGQSIWEFSIIHSNSVINKNEFCLDQIVSKYNCPFPLFQLQFIQELSLSVFVWIEMFCCNISWMKYNSRLKRFACQLSMPLMVPTVVKGNPKRGLSIEKASLLYRAKQLCTLIYQMNNI